MDYHTTIHWSRMWASESSLLMNFNKLQINLISFYEIDGLVQERRNSIANAMELRLSCTNPLKCKHLFTGQAMSALLSGRWGSLGSLIMPYPRWPRGTITWQPRALASCICGRWDEPEKKKWEMILHWRHNKTIPSQITSVSIVYSTVCSAEDQRNIKALLHWLLRGEFTGDRWIPHTKGQTEYASIWWRHHDDASYCRENRLITIWEIFPIPQHGLEWELVSHQGSNKVNITFMA